MIALKHLAQFKLFKSSPGFILSSLIVLSMVLYTDASAGNESIYTIPAGSGLLSAQADTNDLIHFSIAPKPLNAALNDFARATDWQLGFNAALTESVQAPGINGKYKPGQALDLLLKGSGLGYRFTGANTVTLVKNPAGIKLMQPVTVRGELLARARQDTQTSVSVVTGEELDRSTDKDLFDTVDRLPNINAQGGGYGFVIRGITDRGPGSAGTASAISVQIDGANVPNGQALRTGALSTWDLQQIEVLRGPQSTQQGPNALAGAIILRSKDPGFEQEFKARADYGSFNEQRIAAAVNLPVNDRLATRFSYEDYRSDGDIKSSFNAEEIGEERLETMRARLRYKPDRNLNVILGYLYSDNKLGNQGINERRFSKHRVNSQETNATGITNQLNLRINYRFNDQWSLYAQTSYLDSEYLLQNPLEPGNRLNSPAFRTVDDISLSQELKLQYQADALRAVAGGYYLETDKDLEFKAIIADASRFGRFPAGTSAILGNAFDAQVENYAVFSEAEYRLTSQWLLVAGLRYDWEQQNNVSINQSSFKPEPFPGFNRPPTTVKLDADYSALLPKIGVIYDWSDAISIGFTAQRGYRAGGSATAFVLRTPYEYDPEFTHNYELAFRSVWLNRRLTVNTNLFYTDYKDIQVNIPGPSGTFADATIENAARATLWGGELLSDFDVTPNLSLFANIGYTKTRFDDFILNINRKPTDVSGNEFSQAPRWTGSIGAGYYAGNGLQLEFDVNFTDKSYYTAANDPKELNSSFTLVNARISYHSNSFWQAQLYARNLFDRQYLARKRADGFSSAGDSRVIGISFSADY